MIDLLYLTYNRREFAEASLNALVENTNWDRVSSFTIYDDGSTDGANLSAIRALSRAPRAVHVRLHATRLGNPVAIMNDFLRSGMSDVFAKVDSDVMLPPGWLDSCWPVMRDNPELDLLGIEPPASRKRPPGVKGAPIVDPRELEPGPPRYVPCRSIGGVGLMRYRAFSERRAMIPHSTYGGFTDWQLKHADLKIGWIAPPLNVFLLDRMPTEPWVSLSREYIAKGWQRPWTNYDLSDSHLWEWAEVTCPA